MLTIILACILIVPREPPPKVDFVSAFNAGYDARWRDGKPQSANPHVLHTEARKWWDDGWTWRGWMPDWREFIPGKPEIQLAKDGL